MDNKVRCKWVTDLDIDISYHDNEWGKSVHDDIKLFEMLTLESFQSGLSWITILKKREDFRIAFDGFNPEKVAQYDEKKVAELVSNEKIVRHRGKIAAAINNAKLFLKLQKQYGSFNTFIWGYVGNKPIVGEWSNIDEIPSTTDISNKISKDLKKMGFKFLGATTVYAFMQATGMVNDHTKDCYLYNKG